MTKGGAVLAYTAATGDGAGLQSPVVATLFLSALAPLDEESLFRGESASTPMRSNSFDGVHGGTAILALMHGVDIVLRTVPA